MAADPIALHAGLGPGQDTRFPEAGLQSPDVLAFATDPESEHALRRGLAGYRDPQVWPGGLRAAVAALGGGASARLLFVDLDGIPYPAGAIHELAAVCEVGTVVIALGSDASARFSREVLLAGVSDYLAKPVSASAVREAAARAAAPEGEAPGGGCVAGFAGSGGSGTTTLAAAVALAAAERGRYVSVLDLARPFSALSFLLDVEPAAGLEQLLESAAQGGLDPDMVDGVRAQRAERIAVYAYRFGPVAPPRPPAEALPPLLAELRRRSHLVLVDGLEHPETRAAVLGAVERRVLVMEPTPGGAARSARLLGLLGPGAPLVLVRNHTRLFTKGAGGAALRAAGLQRVRPGVAVPFEPTLPALCDRGWPKGEMPRSLEKPLASLCGRLLAAPGREVRAATGEPEKRSRLAWRRRDLRAEREAAGGERGSSPGERPRAAAAGAGQAKRPRSTATTSAGGEKAAPRRRIALPSWWPRPRSRAARRRPA